MDENIKPKLKVIIYSFDQPKWACAQIRLLQYLALWSAEIELVYGVTFCDDGEMVINDNCIDYGDVFIIQRFFPCPESGNILSKLWASGKPVIYETDDLLTEILSKSMNKPEQAEAILEVIQRADLVTVSTPGLLSAYQGYARQIMVVPNLIDEDLWVHQFLNKRDTDKLVIAYCGTPTHAGDLGIIEDALCDILQKYNDQVILRMYGCGTERLNSLTNVEYREFTDNYFDFVYQSQKTKVDIALAPLGDNIFNQCKSNIKWLEYAIREIPGIYSSVGPYKDSIENNVTGILVENSTQAWFAAIESLIQSESQRLGIAANANTFVRKNYRLDRDRVDYLSLLKRVISESSSTNNRDFKTINKIDLKISDINLKKTDDRYQLWRRQRQMSEIDAQIYAERMMTKWNTKPSFHVFCLSEDGDHDQIIATVNSLQSQLYQQWHLTVISRNDCTIPAFQDLDKLHWLSSVDVTKDLNAASLSSSSDWLILVNEGTLLEPHALIEFADYINEHQEWECIYTDHDSYRRAEYFQDPFFKPDINCEYLYSMDYVRDAIAFKRTTLNKIGNYSDADALRNYDALLRMVCAHGVQAVGHIQNVLFHFRKNHTDYPEALHKKILGNYFSNRDVKVDISQGYLSETLRVHYQHESEPKVSIIIPSKDMLEYVKPCVDSIFNVTAYDDYEVIIVDNGSDDADVFKYYEEKHEQYGDRFRVVEYAFEFNYSAMINLGVDNAYGEYVLQLNNDTLIIQSDWLRRLMHHAQRPEVGVVGAKLLYPGSGKIQHAGVIVGMHEIAGHPYMEHADSKDPGYMSRLQVDQELSAVTGACLLMRKSVYQQIGGMDEKVFKVCYNDVDLCLKTREAGFKVIWSAYSIVLHHGSVSQIETESIYDKKLKGLIRFKTEQAGMMDRWRSYIQNDPAYNRQLTFSEVTPEPDFTCVINWMNASKERPRIFGMPVSGGSGEYRVKAPLRTLARAGNAQIDYTYSASIDRQRVLLASELVRTEADAILVQNFLGDSSIDALEKYKKYSDVFISYALDDLITDLPESNEYRRNIPVNARTRLRKALTYCDRLIVSTEPLRDLCQHMIDDIVVIPNYLESSIWGDLHSERHIASKPRVGWAGAQQHSDDLAFVEDVVRTTANEIDWVFFGMCPASIRPFVAEVHAFEFDFEQYAIKLASLNLDLAIAPLMPHPFNEAKSNLRLLEYGAMGWPVVCTDIFPYKNAPVKRVDNDARSWIAAIRERIYDLDAAYKEGDELKKWVLSNHMLEQHVETWTKSLLPVEMNNRYQNLWPESKKRVK